MFTHLRKDFPYLLNPIIYFDNGATTQKPKQVLNAMYNFYANYTAPVYRGVYKRAEEATELYEQARKTIARFIGAQPSEIIFTKGATEGINAVANSWGAQHLKAGDEIILTSMEHHAQFVPWVRLGQAKGLKVHFIPLKNGKLDYDAYEALLNERTAFVGCVYTSNVLGVTNDVKKIIARAHHYGARVCIDAAQTVAHYPLDVTDLQPDFLVFSGHKLLGPTGIGVLYIATAMQKHVEPHQVGGGMVFSVTENCIQWLPAPQKYEAGTPAIAEAIGLAAAIEYLQAHVPFDRLKIHENNLSQQLIAALSSMNRIRLISTQEPTHMVTFTVDGMHAHDVAAYLDIYGIAVRAGHHCTQPLHAYLAIESSIRVSFYFYNTHEEVTQLIEALQKLFI